MKKMMLGIKLMHGAENDYFVSTSSKYISVEPGYYYRVRAEHFAGMQYPYERIIPLQTEL